LDDDNYLQENNILNKIYKEDIPIFEKNKTIGAIKYSNDLENKKNELKYLYIKRLVTCGLLIKKSILKNI
jgi:hypothetical protein